MKPFVIITLLLWAAACGSREAGRGGGAPPEPVVGAAVPLAEPVTAVPDLSDAPAALTAAAEACTRGVSADCVRVGDHYFSNVPDGRGRQLYQRAADLDWAQAAASPPIAPTARAIGAAGAAVEATRAAWPGVVSGLSGSMQAWAQGLAARVAAAPVGVVDDGLDARAVSYRDAYRWMHQLAHEHDGALRTAILAGTLADLRRDGTCWAVTFHGGMKGEFIAYLAPEDGRLLAVTVIPEG